MSAAIVLGFDDAYAPAATVALFSIFSNTEARGGEIVLFVDQVDPERLKPIGRVASMFGRRIRVVDMNGARFDGLPVSGHVSRASYARLVAADHIDSERLLWIDCDTVAHIDIAELLTLDLPAASVMAGCVDKVVAFERGPALGLAANDPYLNTGVLLMDAAAWRAEGLGRQAIALGRSEAGRLRYWDQCLLNLLLADRKAVIPDRWNYMYHLHAHGFYGDQHPNDEGFRGLVHYTTDEKPWHAWSNRRFARLYQAYATVAPARMPEYAAPRSAAQTERLLLRLQNAGY